MRRRWKGVLLLVWCAVCLPLFGCAVPRLLPQKDLPPTERIGPTGGRVVLVASRSSEFKRRLVEKLVEAVVSSGMAQKTVGVGDLKEIDPSGYDVIVVISACLAWGLDRDVQTFLNRNSERIPRISPRGLASEPKQTESPREVEDSPQLAAGSFNRQEKHANIILVTTSGDGGWLPDRNGREFDAVSSASKMTAVDAVVRDVLTRIAARLHNPEPNSR